MEIRSPEPLEPNRPDDDATGALARRLRTGDREAFGGLYARLQPALYAWACLRIRPEFRRALSADDIVHETWLRAMSAAGGFDPERMAFRPWLFGVAKNVLFEWQRRLHRSWKDRSAGGEDGHADGLDQIPDDVTAVTARLRRDETIRRFLERVGELEEDDRRLLLHCGFEGLRLEEAAQRLGVSKDAATKRWQRLRERLRTWSVPRELLDEC